MEMELPYLREMAPQHASFKNMRKQA